MGRGVLEALGHRLRPPAGDVAARGNFCTVDAAGRITDRRAGRISTERCTALVERLRRIRVPGVELLVEPVKEHRFVLVLRGPGLSGRLSETDPQAVGQPPLPVHAPGPEAQGTADIVNRFVAEARPLLADAAPANMLLLRGFDQRPALPRFPEVYGLRAAAIAAYPMYRGLARLVGMDVLKTGATFTDEVSTLKDHWDAYDFVFLHYKDTDKAGEDGDFAGKVAALERLDAALPGDQGAPPRCPRRQRRPRHPGGPPRPLLAPGARRAGRSVRIARCRGALLRAGLRGGKPRDPTGPRPHAAHPGPRPAPDQVRRLIGRSGRGV